MFVTVMGNHSQICVYGKLILFYKQIIKLFVLHDYVGIESLNSPTVRNCQKTHLFEI